MSITETATAEVPAAPILQEMTDAEMETYKLHRRFDRMGRLVGDDAMNRLMNAHVMVIGLGGVGSWAAESLVRSGVGKITLVDFDEVCITNFNRQLHAVGGMVGKQKAQVMADRMKAINPSVEAIAVPLFYNAFHQAEVFPADAPRPDYVIDAIDNLTAKCHLLDFCRREKIPVITSTGSGGRMDPTQVKVADLAKTEMDPMAKSVRRILREKYAFPTEGEYGIPAIYSTEPATMPKELTYDGGKGFRCVCTNGDNPYFNCDSRNLIMGNASFVTGAFGFVAASHVVKSLIAPTI